MILLKVSKSIEVKGECLIFIKVQRHQVSLIVEICVRDRQVENDILLIYINLRKEGINKKYLNFLNNIRVDKPNHEIRFYLQVNLKKIQIDMIQNRLFKNDSEQ